MKKLLALVLTGLLRFYKVSISPLLPAACRYTPTCSEYGIQAIQKYGPFKGGVMAFKRFISCNPWSKYGHDPLP